MMKEKDYKPLVRGSKDQILARQKLLELFRRRPIPDEILLTQFGLYTRSSVLAKMLFINELYQRIIMTPGIIMEFGVYLGCNLALYESFRAVYEPYNYTRKIVGFDTFKGYTAPGPKDGSSEYAVEGGYAVSERYEEYLGELLDYHEQENVNSHIKKYELVKGDVTVTVKEYLENHPETIVALAFFDLGLYEPTKKCLEAIRSFVTRGTVIALDELNCVEFPGETIALRESFGLDRYKIVRAQTLPDRSYIVVD